MAGWIAVASLEMRATLAQRNTRSKGQEQESRKRCTTMKEFLLEGWGLDWAFSLGVCGGERELGGWRGERGGVWWEKEAEGPRRQEHLEAMAEWEGQGLFCSLKGRRAGGGLPNDTHKKKKKHRDALVGGGVEGKETTPIPIRVQRRRLLNNKERPHTSPEL